MIRRYTSRMFLSIKNASRILAIALIAVLGWGCAVGSQLGHPVPATQMLRVTHQAGGTHYKTIVADDVWYQTFGSSLLIIDAISGDLISSLELGSFGQPGPATDMVLDGTALYIVLEDDALIELDCSYLRSPRIVRKMSATHLGVLPQSLSIAGGELYIRHKWSDAWF